MSFDPFGQHPDSPLPAAVPGGEPGPGGAPIMPDVADAMRRVQLPGMFLVAVGVLNLLYGFYWGFEFAVAVVIPADKRYAIAVNQSDEVGKAFPGLKKMMKDSLAQSTPEGLKRIALIQTSIFAVLALSAALLILIGGIRMLQLRSYGLCLLASLVAATPCVSGSACCCLGEVVGVWSIVVLLAPTVRMAFR